jgi:hypothetical protein
MAIPLRARLRGQLDMLCTARKLIYRARHDTFGRWRWSDIGNPQLVHVISEYLTQVSSQTRVKLHAQGIQYRGKI